MLFILFHTTKRSLFIIQFNLLYHISLSASMLGEPAGVETNQSKSKKGEKLPSKKGKRILSSSPANLVKDLSPLHKFALVNQCQRNDEQRKDRRQSVHPGIVQVGDYDPPHRAAHNGPQVKGRRGALAAPRFSGMALRMDMALVTGYNTP